jgi:hypothetical protein
MKFFNTSLSLYSAGISWVPGNSPYNDLLAEEAEELCPAQAVEVHLQVQIDQPVQL